MSSRFEDLRLLGLLVRRELADVAELIVDSLIYDVLRIYVSELVVVPVDN